MALFQSSVLKDHLLLQDLLQVNAANQDSQYKKEIKEARVTERTVPRCVRSHDLAPATIMREGIAGPKSPDFRLKFCLEVSPRSSVLKTIVVNVRRRWENYSLKRARLVVQSQETLRSG